MKKLLSLILVLALCAFAVSALADDNTVTAIGTGSVKLVPDMASFSIGINTQDALVSTAQAANNAAMDAVITALTGLGVNKDDLQTNSFSVYPVYDYSTDTPVVNGYEVSNTVTVIVRDLAKLPALLDAAVEAGANNVYSLGFQSSQQATAYDQALKAAAQDALRKAALIAQAVGKEAGSVLSLDEISTSTGMVYGGAAYSMESSYSAPIESGVVTVTAQVEATVALN